MQDIKIITRYNFTAINGRWLEIIMSYALDEILTLKEVAQALRLDPRTVKEVAFALGSGLINCQKGKKFLLSA